MISALFFASMLLVGSATPAPGLTPAPSATVAPDTTLALPEIGRVKAVGQSCAVLRDLVIPSFNAARRADARFAIAGSKLPEYARVVDESDSRFGIQREMLLSRIGQQVSNMLEDNLTISRALGDPRFARAADAQVLAERDGLQQIFNAQSERAARLSEFVQRESVAIARGEIAGNSMTDSNRSTPTPTPAPGYSNPPDGQPAMRGISLGDERSMREWTAGIDASIRMSENGAAKTFLAVASDCR